tara:strand:- start:1250 stop:1699 length:450 start_codon:yes stop_codon:yes gene_type:complete
MFYQWSKKVVADRFEEELVVAHLEKGLYYSVRGGIVELLDAMPFEDESRVKLDWISRCAPNEDEIEQTQAVWEMMLKEDLILQYSGEIDSRKPDFKLEKRIPSELLTFGDMQDLLALDIIHEVDDEGWPEQKNEEPTLPDSAKSDPESA